MPMERILLTILYAFLAWLLYYAESAGDNWKDRLPSLFLFMLLVGAIPEGVRLTRRFLSIACVETGTAIVVCSTKL